MQFVGEGAAATERLPNLYGRFRRSTCASRSESTSCECPTERRPNSPPQGRNLDSERPHPDASHLRERCRATGQQRDQLAQQDTARFRSVDSRHPFCRVPTLEAECTEHRHVALQLFRVGTANPRTRAFTAGYRRCRPSCRTALSSCSCPGPWLGSRPCRNPSLRRSAPAITRSKRPCPVALRLTTQRLRRRGTAESVRRHGSISRTRALRSNGRLRWTGLVS